MTRKLPAGTCIWHAINSVRNNLAYAFRISWPWYAVIAPVVVALMLLSTYVTPGKPDAGPGATALIDLIRGLLTMVAFASIAVNWHRYILIDEVPRSTEIYRLDDKTWRYFGNLLLLFLILMVIGTLIGLPIGFIGGLGGSRESIVILTVLLVVPVAGVVALRLGTKFPAIALGRRDFSMKDAWAATAGNNLPIFLVILFEVVAAAFVVAIIGIIAYLTNQVSPTLTVVVAFILGLVVNWIFTIFSITVLTSLYGYFVENRDF
jgi:hypothetical protein